MTSFCKTPFLSCLSKFRDGIFPTEFSICYEICFCFLITDCHLWIQVTFEFECGNIMCFCAEILPKNCNFVQFSTISHNQQQFDHSTVPRPSWRNDISYFSSTPERESIFIRRVTLLLGEVMTHCLCHNPIPWPPRPLIRIRRSFWPGRSYLPPAAVKNKRYLYGRTLMEWYYEG